MGLWNAFLGGSQKEFFIDGKTVHAMYSPGSRRSPAKLTLRMNGDFCAQAIFRRETPFDKMGKAVGISSEIQLNDPFSDDDLYFECDDEDFVKRLFGHDAAKAALKQLLQDFQSVEITPRSCVATKTHCQNLIDQDPGRVTLAADALAQIVLAIPLRSSGQQSVTPLTDGYKISARWLLAFSGIGMFVAVVGLIWALPIFQPVHARPIFLASFKWSMPALLIFIWYAVLRIKGHASSLKETAQVVGLAMAGFILGGFVLMTVCNGLWDASLPERQHVQVLDKHFSRGKNSTTYYLQLSPWGELSKPYELTVSRKEYDRTVIHQPYTIVTRQGAFGFEWISGHFGGK